IQKKFSVSLLRLFVLTYSCAAVTNVYADENEEKKEDIQHVIVYGQKLARTMQETASSVQIITAEELKKNADLATIAEILPGTANLIY
ncbi:hypothetical protein ACKI1K_45240, partial [Streptomyces scabiei]